MAHTHWQIAQGCWGLNSAIGGGPFSGNADPLCDRWHTLAQDEQHIVACSVQQRGAVNLKEGSGVECWMRHSTGFHTALHIWPLTHRQRLLSMANSSSECHNMGVSCVCHGRESSSRRCTGAQAARSATASHWHQLMPLQAAELTCHGDEARCIDDRGTASSTRCNHCQTKHCSFDTQPKRQPSTSQMRCRRCCQRWV